MNIENWIVQVRKGILEFCILSALKEQEYYGYTLVKKLVSIPGLGAKEGTVYALLSRLKQQNLVQTRLEESSSGPVRKYYSLTSKGEKIREMMNDYFETLLQGIKKLKNPGDESNEMDQ